MNELKKNEFVEIGAFWKGRKPKTLSGKAKSFELKEGDSLYVMPNKFATPENRQPQYRVFVIVDPSDTRLIPDPNMISEEDDF